jgi:hypothetical protein
VTRSARKRTPKFSGYIEMYEEIMAISCEKQVHCFRKSFLMLQKMVYIITIGIENVKTIGELH